MLSSLITLALYALGVSLVSAAGPSNTPDCVRKCWDYSQYVSLCDGDQGCLCDDSEFQSTVYQCLYSQCGTAQFASALHHALAICAQRHRVDDTQPTTTSIPALIRQQEGGLQKRAGYQSVSNSVTRSVTRSATNSRSVTRSATRSAPRGSPTRSVPRGSPTRSVPRGSPTRSVPRGSPTRSVPRGSPTKSVTRGSPTYRTSRPVSTAMYMITTIADGQPQVAPTPMEVVYAAETGVPLNYAAMVR